MRDGQSYHTARGHCSRLLFEWSTGNDVSDHYLHHYDFFFTVSPSSTFLIDGVLELKTYLAKADGSNQKPRGHLFWQDQESC